MLDIKTEIAKLIEGPIAAVDGVDVDEDAILAALEIPTDTANGDYAFPCFRLAKGMRTAPQQIAESFAGKIGSALPVGGMIERVQNAGAYINFYLNKDVFCRAVVSDVLAKSEAYGSSTIGEGKTVLVEYSSPNIAKPFHIGHIRSTVIGGSLANIMEFLGYRVKRLNHLGDYGTQFGKLIVAYRRFGSREDVEAAPIETLLKYYTEFHEKAKADPSLDDEARAAFAALERGDAEELALWEWFREESLKEFTDVYDMLGIRFDSYAGESFYSDKMQRVLDELDAKGLLLESDGAQIVDMDEWEMGKALITKSDGSTLYITRDIAAAIYRKEHYDFYKNIYVVASQQDLHFRQWIKIVELMGYSWASDCIHVPFGLVHLESGKMSTREGNVVFLADVLGEAVEKTEEIIREKGVLTEDERETAEMIGIGAVIFQELHNNRRKDYVFSWDKVLSFEGETGPYVQYSYARASSILSKAGEADVCAAAELYTSSNTGGGSGYFTGENAFGLAKLIAGFPETVAAAAEKFEPSIVTRHAVDIAQAFSAYYHDEQILVDDRSERIAKLGLVISARHAVKNALTLLGVRTPEKM
ncbi:MAG: arginine--tRNA ligase [Clostridiales Family XIII bacterium]|nr:arginine--tRNA ligase [Clostridiales Family XIII bacterium]